MEKIKKRNNLLGFTGILAIAADIAGLVGFASGFLQSDMHNFFLHPALWIVTQIAVTLYGNIAFCYLHIGRLNSIYQPRQHYENRDVRNFLLLFAYLLWIPTYLVWLVSAIIIGGSDINLNVLYTLISLVAVGFGGFIIAIWAALISRTLNPDFLVKIYPTDGYNRTVYDEDEYIDVAASPDEGPLLDMVDVISDLKKQ